MLSDDIKRAISCVVQARPGLCMDELILACAPYSWNQVFLALDELVRNGVITLRSQDGLYMISPSLETEAGMAVEGRTAHPRSSLTTPISQV